MEVPFPEQSDPQSNLIEFTKKPREGTLEPVRKTYRSCRHTKTFVDEGKRRVTCQACGALMDPFDVLYEMALQQRRWLEELDTWEARRDSMLSERYDVQWDKDKGDIREPPLDSETLLIWETFRDYFKGKFLSMYKRKRRLRSGPEWFGRSMDGACVSFKYARAQMVPKLVVAPSKEV